MDPILKIDGVTKRFGGLMALAEVDYEVKRGEILGLIGPNGAGKTTMFNCIAGVYRPTEGRVVFNPTGEKEIVTNGYKPEKVTNLGIARTFQNIRLFNELSVLDNVRIGCHCRSKSNFFGAVFRTKSQKSEEAEIIDRSMEWLSFVGLEKEALNDASCLSYGNQRRLEIARALATEPKLIMLDEPAAGMNPQETRMLIDLINAILDQDITVVLIEHDMKLVMTICERLVVLDHGLCIAQGLPEEVRDNPQVVEAYLGRGAADA